MNDYDFLSKVFWGNNIFKFQNKCLSFPNWIKGGLVYVKDMFYSSGCLHTKKYIFDKISNKIDWIREYSVVKLVLKSHFTKFKTSLAKYIKIRKPIEHIHYNGLSNILFTNLKSKDIYNTMVSKIAIRHYMEKGGEISLTNE